MEVECACSAFTDSVIEPFLSSLKECKICVEGPANTMINISFKQELYENTSKKSEMLLSFCTWMYFNIAKCKGGYEAEEEQRGVVNDSHISCGILQLYFYFNCLCRFVVKRMMDWWWSCFGYLRKYPRDWDWMRRMRSLVAYQHFHLYHQTCMVNIFYMTTYIKFKTLYS